MSKMKGCLGGGNQDHVIISLTSSRFPKLGGAEGGSAPQGYTFYQVGRK